jgi:AcrR family transcriptional regulator
MSSSRLTLPPPSRERRSQAERTAETRARILAAVVESIAEVGFQRTTAAEIAQRAGVTWGAVQHHFGGKDGILLAVLEDTFNRFAVRLDDLPAEAASLEERASLFVARAWEHFSSPHYRSTFEILLGYMPREAPGGDAPEAPSLQRRMWEAWEALFARLFADAPVSRRRRALLAHYALAALSGLAFTLILQGQGAAVPDDELALLERTLVRELGA